MGRNVRFRPTLFHPVFQFLFQHSRPITTPYMYNPPFRRYNHVMRNTFDTIMSVYSHCTLHIIQVGPCNTLSFGCFFPNLFTIRTDTHYNKSVFPRLLHLTHLRKSHKTRATACTPKVKQQIPSFKIRQMTYLTFQVIQVRIVHTITYRYNFRRKQLYGYLLSFFCPDPLLRNTLIQSFQIFDIRKRVHHTHKYALRALICCVHTLFTGICSMMAMSFLIMSISSESTMGFNFSLILSR